MREEHTSPDDHAHREARLNELTRRAEAALAAATAASDAQARRDAALQAAEAKITKVSEELPASVQALADHREQLGTAMAEIATSRETAAAVAAALPQSREAIESHHEAMTGLVQAARDRDAVSAKHAKSVLDASTESTEQAAQIATTLAAVKANQVTIANVKKQMDATLKSAKADQAKTAALAEIAASTEARLDEYETELESLDARARELNTQIEGLLPGATSSGLAATFHARRETVVTKQTHWKWVYYSCIAAIFGIAVQFALPVLKGDGPAALGSDWPQIVTMLAARILLLGPLVWLAIFASRQLKILLMLEEDYSHKVVISNSFQGYKTQLSEIDGAEESAAQDLAHRALKELSNSPVRLYGKKVAGDTPVDVLLSSVVRKLGDLATVADRLSKKG